MTDRFKVDQRAALFGNRSRAGNTSIGRSSNPDLEGQSHRETLEQQNDSRLDDLQDRVSKLKEITKGISKEAKDSLSFLEGLGQHFEKAGSLLQSTVGKLTTMTQAKMGRSGMMVCGFLAVFVLLYFISSLRGGADESPVETAASVNGAAT
eukprot:CAMPEP_0206469978 /NCGR_PEP_ID=MMETSP0324_2-20121206/30625_1 /ASSEMBLY_ACC=CAM_ASM_000836 /TAXON_ID=2866 /ORGANISM="Crypthecodinium cohnii, Strain Seligo" /LENGTH=150 /DNA_ID=CAMNT_0053943887 /DNA_START=41 /DNA_END=490 /DNA_ORIENTATION=-